MNPSVLFVGLVPALTPGSTPASQVLLSGQERSVLVMADAAPCSPVGGFEGADAEGFEPFDVVLEASRSCENFGAEAVAAQRSTITTTVLNATGSTSAETVVEGFDFVLALANSDYQVDFELPAPIRVHLTGQLSASAAAELPPSYSAQASMVILSGFDVIFDHIVQAPLNAGLIQETVDVQLLLAPGTYTFRASCDAVITDAFPTSGQFASDYEVLLEVFAPADLNLDGGIDAADLALLLGGWGPQANHPADLNQDGLVDAADLALLLGSWEEAT